MQLLRLEPYEWKASPSGGIDLKGNGRQGRGNLRALCLSLWLAALNLRHTFRRSQGQLLAVGQGGSDTMSFD